MRETADFLTFDEFFRHWAAVRGDAAAYQEGDRLTTFAELEERSRRIAGMLRSLGIRKGERIAWIGKNAGIYFQMFYAAARIGVVMAPISWRLAPAEMAYILKDTGAVLILAGHGFDDVARALGAEIPTIRAVLDQDALSALIDATAPVDVVAAGPDDAVLQLYTSGTTGHPKGAILSQRNFFGLRKPGLDAGLPWAEWTPDEAVLVCMPCAHIGGTALGVMGFSGGVRSIIQPEFSGEGALRGVADGATRFFIVPAALQMLIEHPNAVNTDFSRLKYVLYGAAPIPLDLLREAVKAIPNAGFMQCYGMTETTGTICQLPPEDHDMAGTPRMRSAGKAVPGSELRIVDTEGREVPRGTVGEVETRSSNNMLGYWNLPEATAKTLSADGWVRTGDAAWMDEDGYIFIQDRIKDMIISGGENVYPAEVESAIYGHPDIAEVAVIGVPDAKWGEAVKACVVPKPGHSIDPAEVIAWARTRIAGFKVPKSVDVIEALPRNPAGKILRRTLREPYWANMERQVN